MLVFIDESGTLPDKQDKYIVIAALVTNNPTGLDKILPKFRKKIPYKGKRKKEKQTKEFKFHYVGEITRKKVLEEINQNDIYIWLLVIDKIGRKIADTPENYGKLLIRLIKKIVRKQKISEIFLDKHFDQFKDADALQNLIEEKFENIFKFTQIDSLVDSRINLADFIAGSILKKYSFKEDTFYKIISNKIRKEEVKKWNEL